LQLIPILNDCFAVNLQYPFHLITTATLITSTIDTTVTTLTEVTSTVTIIPIVGTYSLVQGSDITGECTYNSYIDTKFDDGYTEVSDDPTDDYATGVDQCEALCTAYPACNFFLFPVYEPVAREG